ncbi:MAG: thrombospondin type 3 repeat-containing protein, partial [Gemmatimonadales bacterium]|nr:thrombospondin type 3 repeat-containing protein [Gemmatimonadales bacterium]
MKLRALVLPCLLFAGLFAPAANAQRQGTVEFGAYVRKNWFGESYGLHQVAGAGARLGFFPIRHVELEADAVFTPTHTTAYFDKVNVMRFAGMLTFHMPIGEHSAFILGGGGVYNRYKLRENGLDQAGNAKPSIDVGHEFGPGALAGFRFGLGDVVSIRLDGTLDRFGKPAPELTENIDKDWHYGFQAGLAFLFGNRGESFRGGAADADKDGVMDTADQCPNTPRGTQVNSSGCPLTAANPDAAADSLRMRMRADSMAA